MGYKLFYILKQDALGSMIVKYSCDLKEHCASDIIKAFHFADYRKGLARKSRKQQVVAWYLIGRYSGYVAMWFLSKVAQIGQLGGFVPL